MGFGAEGTVVVMVAIYALLTTVITAVVASVGVSLWSRRAVAWTPMVLVALGWVWMLANLPWTVLIVLTLLTSSVWFAWVWPWRQPAPIPGRRQPWRPATALLISLGAFGLLSAIPAFFFMVSIHGGSSALLPNLSTRTSEAKPSAPRRMAPIAPPAPGPSGAELELRFGTEASHDGLTWTVLHAIEENGVRYVLVGVDERSDAYAGDTPPHASLPILAIRSTDIAPPSGIDPNRWSHGEVMLTDAIQGRNLSSLAFANFFIEEKLGRDWRMASFHEAAGWRFWAVGDLEAGIGQRFWVTIRDQPANPWN